MIHNAVCCYQRIALITDMEGFIFHNSSESRLCHFITWTLVFIQYALLGRNTLMPQSCGQTLFLQSQLFPVGKAAVDKYCPVQLKDIML